MLVSITRLLPINEAQRETIEIIKKLDVVDKVDDYLLHNRAEEVDGWLEDVYGFLSCVLDMSQEDIKLLVTYGLTYANREQLYSYKDWKELDMGVKTQIVDVLIQNRKFKIRIDGKAIVFNPDGSLI